MDWLWVAAGAGLGGMARYWCSGAVARRIGETFPWGTLVVNVAGSAFVGLFAALTAAPGALSAAPEARQLLVAGLCGGYTTFSSFSLQTLTLVQDGEWAPAAANAVLSVALCVAAAWLGLCAGQALPPG
jgi:CrcB protein